MKSFVLGCLYLLSKHIFIRVMKECLPIFYDKITFFILDKEHSFILSL